MSTGNGNGTGNQGEQPRAVVVPPTRGIDMGGQPLEPRHETASAALAAHAEAEVKARVVMAIQRPRDIEKVRVKILAACKRPGFAKTAIYRKPVGKKKNEQTGKWEEAHVEGLNIRFAEEAIRNLGNAMTQVFTIYDDPKKRILRVTAADFETNVVHSKDITVEKTVERRYPKPGQVVLATRTNSYGDTVAIVEATEDDMAVKGGAQASKGLRDKILMLIPGDIQEEARAQIKKTQADEDAKDPKAAKREVIDAFSENGIMPDQLTEYIGHDLEQLTPAELQNLRAIFSAIREGEATWADVIEKKRDFEKEKTERDKAKAEAKSAGGGTGKQGVEEIAAAAKAKREAEKPAAQPTPAASQAKPSGPAQQTLASGKPAEQPAAKPPEDEDDKGDVPDWMK